MSEPDPDAGQTPAQAREAESPLSVPARGDVADDVRRKAPWMTIIGVVGSLLVFLALVLVMDFFTRGRRAADRETPESKLAETRDADRKVLTTYGYADAQKKAVRIPIDRAMQIVADEAEKARASAKSEEANER